MNEIEVKIYGDNVRPDTLDIKDLTLILSQFEKSLVDIMADSDKTLNRNDIVISLINIESGSVKAFLTSHAANFLIATSLLSNAIDTNNYSSLPASVPKYTEELVQKVRSKKLNIDITIQSLNQTTTITPDTVVSIEKYTFAGVTTIYAQIERIGGVDPAVVIKQPNSPKALTCHIKQDIAKYLAKDLYDTVKLTGMATWDARTYDIIAFDIESIEPFENVSISDAVAKLRDIASKYFDPIEDIDEYCKKLRED